MPPYDPLKNSPPPLPPFHNHAILVRGKFTGAAAPPASERDAHPLSVLLSFLWSEALY